MMVDRFGHPVCVGWSDHHILWIEAAMTLPHAERVAAFEDIGELTGRVYASVCDKSRHILRLREEARRRTQAQAPISPPAAFIAGPSRAQLMGSGRGAARAMAVSA